MKVILYLTLLFVVAKSQYCQLSTNGDPITSDSCKSCVTTSYGGYSPVCNYCVIGDQGFCVPSYNTTGCDSVTPWALYNDYDKANKLCNVYNPGVCPRYCKNGGILSSQCTCACPPPWGGLDCKVNLTQQCGKYFNCYNGHMDNLDARLCECTCNPGYSGYQCDIYSSQYTFVSASVLSYMNVVITFISLVIAISSCVVTWRIKDRNAILNEKEKSAIYYAPAVGAPLATNVPYQTTYTT